MNNNISLYVYTTFYLSIHSSADILGCFHLLAIVNNADRISVTRSVLSNSLQPHGL